MRRKEAFRRPKNRSILPALLVKLGIKILRHLAVGFGRDYSDRALFPDHLPDPVGVIGLVGQHRLPGLLSAQQQLADRRVMILSGRQLKPDRQAYLIDKSVDFRG